MSAPPVDGDDSKRLLRQAAEEHQRATPLLDLWKSMPYRDTWAPTVQSAFWSEGSSSSYADQIRRSGAALYIVGGWRDEFRDQGLITHLNVPGSRILIGDWLHCQNVGFALHEEAHRFFDQWLKSIDTGITREPPIHYYTVGAGSEGEWRTAAEWPLPQSQLTDFFLGPTGLQSAPPRAAIQPGQWTVRHDPSCPGPGGPLAQPCHSEGNGLSFSTGPLESDVELTGHGIADLWIAATARDANIFLYVEDVAPDGTVSVISEGRLKASLRKVAEAPWKLPGLPWHRAYAEDSEMLEADQPVRLQFDILPLSYVFRKGHRLQLTVTGSDPRERARDEQATPPRITLLGGPETPSRVALPVVRGR